jgi:hypothetical protein
MWKKAIRGRSGAHGRQWMDGEMGEGPCELEKGRVTDVKQ